MPLNEAEKETLLLISRSGMNISKAAETLGCTRKTVYDRLRTIENKTGIDPSDFWGLHKLLTEVESDKV